MTVVGKFAWVALWTCVAVAAVGFEMDRAARHNASLAEHVPAPFRGFALEVLARGDLARGDSAAGLQLAREMVARRPVPAEGLAMIAMGELATGREQPALAAVMMAAERGWRDNFTQAIVVRLAVQSGEWNIASQRLLALWRMGGKSDELYVLSGDLLKHRDGLAAFESQLRAEAGWSNGLLRWSTTTLEPLAVGTLAGTLRKEGAKLDCSWLAAGSFDAIKTGRGAAVEALWQQACSSRPHSASAGSVGKLAFTAADEEIAGPFDWHYPSGAGLESEVIMTPSGLSLRFSNAEPIRQPIARRFAMLPAGAHTLATSGDVVKSSMGLRPTLNITCYNRNGTALPIGKIDLSQGVATFSLSEACVSQLLTIEIGTGSGIIDQVVVD